jgi:GNAT superfamily N-acetyltransferase
MDIREAAPEDNHELQELQAQCPMGTNLIVSQVNTPDFFARANAYQSCRVYVACEDERIVGSASCAVREAVVGGKIGRVGYEFQYFTSPQYRRSGVAHQLHRHIEDQLTRDGAVLSYLAIMEDNLPSMRLFEREGFNLHRTLTMPCLLVFKEMDVPSGGTIRPATEEDLGAIAELLNETWKGFELYEPTSADLLARFVARTPAYSLDSLLILEERGEMLACLGFWDWSRVMRMTVKALSSKMRMMGLLLDVARLLRPMPHSPKPGRTLRQIMLTPIGFKDPGDLAALLRHLNNLALERGIEQVFCVCEPGHAMLTSTKGFVRMDTAIRLYVKPLRENVSIGDGPVFVDGVDLS